MDEIEDRETDAMILRLEKMANTGKVKSSYVDSCIDFLNDIRDKDYVRLTRKQADWFDDIEDMLEEDQYEV